MTLPKSSRKGPQTITDQHRTFEKNMRDFISVEVQTSLTFATSALKAEDKVRRAQEISHARKGYDTALRFMAEARQRFPSEPVPSETIQGLQNVRRMLKELGEELPSFDVPQ